MESNKGTTIKNQIFSAIPGSKNMYKVPNNDSPLPRVPKHGGIEVKMPTSSTFNSIAQKLMVECLSIVGTNKLKTSAVERKNNSKTPNTL